MSPRCAVFVPVQALREQAAHQEYAVQEAAAGNGGDEGGGGGPVSY